ncbi:MAG: S41 family peptidase, partial [Planctomycetota bacterium]
DWLLANELYYRLSVLLEQEGAYRGDVKRLGSRLSMIRLYAPERFWEMRDERRRLEGLDPLPPYNPTGDRYDEKLEDVNERMLLVALQRAANQHLDHDRQTMGELLQSGLAALETFVTTPDLADTFPGLNDARKRREFLDGVAELSNTIADDEGVGFSDALRAVRRAIALNRATIGVDVEAIVHEFGNGSMSALDDYSAIIWPDEIRRFERSTRGEFVGVGIQIQLDELQNIKVVTPLEGTPAQKAGVRAEDRIVGVNGVSTVGFTLDQAVEVITGPRNTDVTLTIERGEGDDTERFDLNVDRRVINLPTVKGWRKTGPDDLDWDWFIDPDAGVGYVRITSFAENTTDAFDAAIRDMKRSESGLNALILDLRFNPGGLLDQAVSISNRFVPPDRLIEQPARVEPQVE